MEQNELELATELQEQNEECDNMECDEVAAKRSLWQRVRPCLPQTAIWARYLLPALTVLVLFVMSFFYNVMIYNGGVVKELSVLRLYLNTFKGMHNYFGGETVIGRTNFYTILTVGAVVGILCFLAALFLKALSTYAAVRAFLAGHESEESDKAKLIFKIAFPNRVWLFLSDLLILLPLLYPHFFSLVGRKFLAIGGEEVIFVLLNRPLIVGAILTVLTLVLALIIPKHERRKKMNMFLLHRMEETKPSEEENDEDQ